MFLSPLTGFVASLLCLWLLLRKFPRVALDAPNERSLHDRPVPRTGGIAVLFGSLASLPIGSSALWIALLLATALAIGSFIDDLRGLPASMRLGLHLLASVGAVWAYAWPAAGPVAALLLVFAIAWLANLYNFMDGSDGLAGGMAVIGFGTLGLAAAAEAQWPLVSACLGIAGAAAAFLIFNFSPARIFMGDVGAVPLGFLVGALGLVGWRDGAWPLWFPLMVFAPFICDASLTLLTRLLRRERVTRPHRDHYYQRLVRMGFGHRRTALIEYVAMASCAVVALYARAAPQSTQVIMIVACALALTAVAVWVDVRWARFRKASGSTPG